MKKQIHNTTLELVRGDITTLEVDAIVNAANEFLMHGGGVALAIVRKGGLSIQVESTALVAKHGRVATGNAVMTSSGKLPAKFVIHTVGPVWSQHTPTQADNLLRSAVRNSLALANEKNLRSIAFPAISTGIYGFPIERAAPLMLQEAIDYAGKQTNLQRVIFCLFDTASYQVFEAALLNI